MPHPHRAEALSNDARLTSVCLSVAYIWPKSRTERPGKTKIGTEVAHVTYTWLGHHFQCQRSNVNLQGSGHIVAASRTACLSSVLTFAFNQKFLYLPICWFPWLCVKFCLARNCVWCYCFNCCFAPDSDLSAIFCVFQVHMFWNYVYILLLQWKQYASLFPFYVRNIHVVYSFVCSYLKSSRRLMVDSHSDQ